MITHTLTCILVDIPSMDILPLFRDEVERVIPSGRRTIVSEKETRSASRPEVVCTCCADDACMHMIQHTRAVGSTYNGIMHVCRMMVQAFRVPN